MFCFAQVFLVGPVFLPSRFLCEALFSLGVLCLVPLIFIVSFCLAVTIDHCETKTNYKNMVATQNKLPSISFLRQQKAEQVFSESDVRELQCNPEKSIIDHLSSVLLQYSFDFSRHRCNKLCRSRILVDSFDDIFLKLLKRLTSFVDFAKLAFGPPPYMFLRVQIGWIFWPLREKRNTELFHHLGRNWLVQNFLPVQEHLKLSFLWEHLFEPRHNFDFDIVCPLLSSITFGHQPCELLPRRSSEGKNLLLFCLLPVGPTEPSLGSLESSLLLLFFGHISPGGPKLLKSAIQFFGIPCKGFQIPNTLKLSLPLPCSLVFMAATEL